MEQNELVSAADIPGLVERWHGPLIGYASRYLGQDQGEEVAQETWVRLLCVKEPVHLETIRPWLFRVATNLIRDALRRRHLLAFLPLSEEWDVPDPFDTEAEVVARDLLERAFAHLHQSEIILIAQAERGVSMEAMAQAARVPVGTMKARLHFARKALREWCAKEAS